MNDNEKLLFLAVVSNIISLLVISLHLLNQKYEWFPSWLFCIRSIFVIMILNLLLLLVLLVVWIFSLSRKKLKL